LQRTIGNQAVQQMLRTDAEEREAGVTGTGALRLEDAVSRTPRRPLAGPIQTKLTINNPEDEYEQEADRISEHVMRMPEPRLQRAGACGGAYPQGPTEQPGQAPASRDGQRLPAHQLAPVQQHSGSAMLLRQPDPDKTQPGADTPPPAPPSAYPEWKPADAVVELRWLKGKDWEITLSGRTSLESARAMLWPKWMPSSVTMNFNVAITDPIERGWFTISGLEGFHLEYMEPSIAAIFRDRGVVDDTKDSPELATARDAFRENNSDLGEWMHSAIHVALKRATRANADLMLAFYRYYSSHDLERDDMRGLGDTSSGDTEISERVLMLEENPKLTNDPLSLLGSTLIHEFVHTPHGAKELGGQVTQLTKEGKAYAIELLFSERMGDTTRAADIEKQWFSHDSLIMGAGADKVFNRSYKIISKLYEIIDSKGGTEAAAARRMSVEFISKNEADYGRELRDFISRNAL
jgi:hypothetical protein